MQARQILIEIISVESFFFGLVLSVKREETTGKRQRRAT